MIVWSRDNNKLLDLLNKNSDPKKFDQFEKDFCFDQKSLTIKTWLSNDVDVGCKEQVLQLPKAAQDDEEKLQEEMSFIFQEKHIPLENRDQSLNASLTDSLNLSMTCWLYDLMVHTPVKHRYVLENEILMNPLKLPKHYLVSMQALQLNKHVKHFILPLKYFFNMKQ